MGTYGFKSKLAIMIKIGKTQYFFMLALLKPIIFTFLKSKAIKQLALDIVKAAVKKTDNNVDDRLADMLEKALFPGR